MEAFPIAIHNKIRRQKVTIAIAAECRLGALPRAGGALGEAQGLLRFILQAAKHRSAPVRPYTPLDTMLIADHRVLASAT